jgi:hypothetical protein
MPMRIYWLDGTPIETKEIKIVKEILFNNGYICTQINDTTIVSEPQENSTSAGIFRNTAIVTVFHSENFILELHTYEIYKDKWTEFSWVYDEVGKPGRMNVVEKEIINPLKDSFKKRRLKISIIPREEDQMHLIYYSKPSSL